MSRSRARAGVVDERVVGGDRVGPAAAGRGSMRRILPSRVSRLCAVARRVAAGAAVARARCRAGRRGRTGAGRRCGWRTAGRRRGARARCRVGHRRGRDSSAGTRRSRRVARGVGVVDVEQARVARSRVRKPSRAGPARRRVLTSAAMSRNGSADGSPSRRGRCGRSSRRCRGRRARPGAGRRRRADRRRRSPRRGRRPRRPRPRAAPVAPAVAPGCSCAAGGADDVVAGSSSEPPQPPAASTAAASASAATPGLLLGDDVALVVDGGGGRLGRDRDHELALGVLPSAVTASALPWSPAAIS